jgi:hypothetical protein
LSAFAVFMLVMCTITTSNAGGIGTYAEGYRYGEIHKFSIKGKSMRSGEGEMLVGIESDRSLKGAVVTNPWAFSIPMSLEDGQKNVRNNMGKYVVVKYKQYKKKSPNVETDYEVVDILPVSDKAPKTCMIQGFEEEWDDGIVGKMSLTINSKGNRAGRIVKASKKGHLKSHEVTIQLGNAGSNFFNMSILDENMYKCAVEFLKAGQKANIYYIENRMRNGMNRDTPYNIIRIDSIQN